MTVETTEETIAKKAKTDGTFAVAYALLEINKTLDSWRERSGEAAYEAMIESKAIRSAIYEAGESVRSGLVDCANAIGDIPG